ncbi:hypothetical protein HOT45_gp48 [Gordonia phage Trine]|uniref:Uncharacterized protein n=1 Tax=Gordonia phage Trine TaxID=2201431 RepID=A0A2Z4Q9N7_9CAUD|nr:hypothetical protein HOT45_gp48 [Gordonia phage Trine]AWY06549.1 hypothetical protein PBI_TRINE_48 [Gordonia phage Trine]
MSAQELTLPVTTCNVLNVSEAPRLTTPNPKEGPMATTPITTTQGRESVTEGVTPLGVTFRVYVRAEGDTFTAHDALVIGGEAFIGEVWDGLSHDVASEIAQDLVRQHQGLDA